MTYTGKALQGCAVKFNTTFWLGGRYKCLIDGAFDESLKSGSIVEAWLQHNPALVWGDTRKNMILHSDSYGLWFRAHLRTDEISRHVHALVKSKAFTEMSVGFSYYHADAETLKIGGHDVVVVKKATLREASLVEAGACPTTNATLVDAKDCRSLFEDCKSLAMRSENTFDDVMRKLRRLQQ